ncbi:DUF5713 family protein [Lacipirellula sp.]|uniref:DUF5713 family protein n=1 Tax=Lacipirellula sp. TaxID=2691419 RepID=UPI003D0C0465
MAAYPFLAEMYEDDYFPNALVDKGKAILVRLCEQIEVDQPESLDDLYALTHAATDEFNDLAVEFEEEDSEIETGARDAIGGDFAAIARAYVYDADIEELIATRDW